MLKTILPLLPQAVIIFCAHIMIYEHLYFEYLYIIRI